jgi:hypothetical protein
MKDYLQQHFEKVKYIESSTDLFHQAFPKINWLYNHVIKYNGNNKNFKLWRKYGLIGYDDERVIIAYVKPQFNGLNYNEVLINSIYDTYMLMNVEKNSTKGNEVVISENYTRFYGKKIISCVFSLDRKEPYYISWNDEGVNLVEANSDLLRSNIYQYLKTQYMSENNSIYYFYNYWRRNTPEDQKGAGKFIAFLQDKYNDNKEKGETERKKFPSYIGEFINYIKSKVDDCDDKKGKRKILEEYDNKEFLLINLDALYYSGERGDVNNNNNNNNKDTTNMSVTCFFLN